MKRYLYLALALISLLQYACGTPAVHPINYPSSASTDDRIIGTWKYEEDTDKANYYEITKADKKFGKDFQYHVRFFNRGGSNPSYESNVFFSDVDSIRFLNVPYFGKTSKGEWEDRGYFYLRIIDANKDFTKITTATVNDPELSRLKSKLEIRQYMSQNVHDPNIYSDTAHLYKILPVKGIIR